MIQAINAAAVTGCESASHVQPRMDFPTGLWTLNELFERAKWEDRQIGQSQRCCPRYWFFGKVLLLVQAQVREGGWKAWCIENRIQRDRWHRGRLLALAFASPDQVANMTIDDAEALAREILGLPKRRSTADAKLRRSLVAIDNSLGERLNEFDEVSHVNGVRQRLAEILRKVTRLDAACAAFEMRHAAPAQKSTHG